MRWRRPTQPGWRSPSRGCSPGRRGGGSRCRVTRSSASATGCSRPDEGVPRRVTPCWACGTSRRAARSPSRQRCSRRIRPGWRTTGSSAGWWRPARCTAPWRPRPPSRREAARWSWRTCSCTTRWSSRSRTPGTAAKRAARCRSCSTTPSSLRRAASRSTAGVPTSRSGRYMSRVGYWRAPRCRKRPGGSTWTRWQLA